MILNKFPTPEEFYADYWCKKPFVVKSAIPKEAFDNYIDGNTLAGLSLEEDIKSRLILTAKEDQKWQCEHGPLAEDRFENLDETHWSLLVQNVDQHHPETADLLEYFNFSPRWLLDDIMVSYSTINGSVGPHTDSYHVFLVQGIGQRKWRVGTEAILDEECIAGLDLKVLKDGFDGEEFIVDTGDVIYIPPHFGHEGITTKEAMTFSVGFLGPKMSELLIEYGYYLEETETHNTRYIGQNLKTDGLGHIIPSEAQSTIKNEMLNTLHADSFSEWLVEYFSSSNDDSG
jgi:50S ribosomal protein L16 3-hydroxylase